MKIKADYVNAPQWRELTVKSRLPEQLKCLDELAHNMWWAWNYEARDLWRSLDENCTKKLVIILFYCSNVLAMTEKKKLSRIRQ